jgi:hypothetical protein
MMRNRWQTRKRLMRNYSFIITVPFCPVSLYLTQKGPAAVFEVRAPSLIETPGCTPPGY